jgi:lysophospholipase L1-like esterase
MSARGRFLSGLVSMVIALAGLVTVGALPAAATNSHTVQYVALGDSYAAGQGAGDYLDNICKQTGAGYPELLDFDKRIDLQINAACSGARITDVATQLTALSGDTGLVTLTVGATELNVSAVATACLGGTQEACQAEIVRVQRLLGSCPDPEVPSALDSPLTSLYAQVANAAPNALVVVTGYPQLFELIPGDPNEAIKAAINDATTALNCVIERAVTATQATGVNIVYVDVTKKFKGHGIDGKKPFINSTGLDPFHPNAAGYDAYAAAISAQVPDALWLDGKSQLV